MITTSLPDTGAPFQQVTDETREEPVAKVKYGSEDEYLYEIYSAYGAFGQLKPANWANADYLGELDTDAYAEVLEEAGVMERSDTRLWVSFTRLKAFIEDLADDKEAFVEFFETASTNRSGGARRGRATPASSSHLAWSAWSSSGRTGT